MGEARPKSRFRGMFSGMFGGMRKTFDSFEQTFDDFDKMFEELDREVDATEAPKAGETIRTRREETRPDGTHVVTTVTRSRR
jgi:hypothetical protein